MPFVHPQSGAIEIDGVDIRAFDLASWRRARRGVFQDFIRLELLMRDNVRRQALRRCRARGSGVGRRDEN